jgi:hypothetical protein
MSFTWNGQAVSDIIPIGASYDISGAHWAHQSALSQSTLESNIRKELALSIAHEIVKLIDIHVENDYTSLKRTYYAKAHMAVIKQHSPLPNPTSIGSISTSSAWNGVSMSVPITHTSGSSLHVSPSGYASEYEKFRVCEYTKNGKVTRVELQYNVDGMWEKIPRVKIEE